MNPGTSNCRNCGAALPPGASFCTLCGAAVYNRAGRTAPAAASEPSAPENPRKVQIPGIIPVTPFSRGPVVAPKIDDGEDMAARLDLVNAGAGKRLAAKLLDMVAPAIGFAIGSGVGATTIVSTRVNAQVITLDLFWFSVWTGAAALLALAYWIVLWGWEARTGKTIGNLLLGIRTTGMQGFAAGWLAILVRNVIITIGFGLAFVGGVLVLISNLWDRNGQRQSWPDKAAHTLVFDVKAGRDPLTSGGIDGPSSFAPVELPPMLPVQSPVAGTAAPGLPTSAAPPSAGIPGFEPAEPAPGRRHDPNQWQPPASPGVRPETVHPDEAAGETRYRSAAQPDPVPAAVDPAPAVQRPSVRMQFDDGREVRLAGAALIGRNPSGYDGEVIEQLIDVPDPSRSVSKTHVHVRASSEGLWVTDRNSTNGSALSGPDGVRRPLVAGSPELAGFGATVHFGDRSFLVARA
ncbi:MAG: RDD family protein [Renibacterium sp.]|nr:RDD family protein [Renibacterium sp.]